MELNDLEMQILKCLRESSQPVSSDRLAEVCGVSKNTIRRRIAGLNSAVQEEGFDIFSKPSSGYQIEITDAAKANFFFDQLNQQFLGPLFGQNNDQEYRKHYLVRRLLATNGYLSPECLCEELYYSRSSVKKLLDAASLWLREFDLIIRFKRNHGYYIDGSEWKKRLALLYQDKIFVNLPQELQKVEEAYIRVLLIDSRLHRRWYPFMQQYVRQSSKIAFSVIDFPIFAHYIELIPSRARYQKQISFTPEQKLALDESGLLTESRKILEHFHDKLPVTDIETEAFAMVILALRSITDGSQLTEAERLRLQKETAEIIELLQDKLCFSAFADKDFLERFSWQWYYVKNKILFDIPADEEYSRPQNKITPNFLALDLAAELNSYIVQKYGKHLRMSQIQPLFYSLQEFVAQKMNTAFSCRMAIVSVYGSPYASFLADRIKEEYGFYIKETVVMEYTQLNDSVDECFDFLATDLRVHMRPAFQKCRVLEINTSEHSKNLLPELDRFFQKKTADARSALVSSEVLETRKVTSDKLLLLLAGKNAERLPTTVPEDTHFSESTSEQPCVVAERPEKKMIFLRCQSEKKEDYIKIYHCSEKVKWGNCPVRTIVCYSYSGKDAQKLYYLNQVLTRLEQKNAL